MAKRATRKLRPAAKAAPRRKATKRAGLPRLSLRDKLVADLVSRVRAQIEDAQAIAKITSPTGQTIYGEWPTRRVIEMAMNVHVGNLVDILTRAQNLER